MKERPIIMGAESVRAILEGRKTQTMRVVTGNVLKMLTICTPDVIARDMPKYHIGDRLWVKETWGVGCRPDPCHGWIDGIEYKADLPYLDENEDLHMKVIDDQDISKYENNGWNSPMFMPRWASRITLEITDIRVKRVQDISEEDAKAEGIKVLPLQDESDPSAWYQYAPGIFQARSATKSYELLWDSLNAKRGYPWEKNPWVLAVTFKVVQDATR